MNERSRLLITLFVGVALPLLASQLLPSSNPDRWSPVAIGLLVTVGALAGWTAPTARGFITTVAWVVAGSMFILLSWTDLLLNVGPSILPVETWRDETFVAIAAALGFAAIGFVAGALVHRRGAFGSIGSSAAVGVVAILGVAIVAAGIAAVAFSRTPLVLQPDQALVTVVITDDGIAVTPEAIDGRSYWLIYESRATVPMWITRLTPLTAQDGVPRALTTAEIESWLAGTWQDLGPEFLGAISWQPIDPGQRVDGGPLAIRPSIDGSGGALWYASSTQELRPWPGNIGEEMRPEAPWPVDHHVVVSVHGS